MKNRVAYKKNDSSEKEKTGARKCCCYCSLHKGLCVHSEHFSSLLVRLCTFSRIEREKRNCRES